MIGVPLLGSYLVVIQHPSTRSTNYNICVKAEKLVISVFFSDPHVRAVKSQKYSPLLLVEVHYIRIKLDQETRHLPLRLAIE